MQRLPSIINPDVKPLLKEEDLTRQRTYTEKMKLYTFIVESKDGISFLEKVGKGLVDDESAVVEKGISKMYDEMPYMRYEWERGFVGEWYKYFLRKGLNKKQALKLAKEKLYEEQYGIKSRDLFFIFLPESAGNPFVTSVAGARGLYQFIPSTARYYGIKKGKVDYRSDPLRSAYAAGRMFAQLMIRGYDILTSTVAYNGGESRTYGQRTYDKYFDKLRKRVKRYGLGSINVENLEYPGRFVATIAYLQHKRPDVYEIEPLDFDVLRINFPNNLFFEYKVRKGDSLQKISRKFSRSPRSLLYLLRLMYGNRIYAGQVMRIPKFTGEELTIRIKNHVKKSLGRLHLSRTQIKNILALNDTQIWSGFLGGYPVILIIPKNFSVVKQSKEEMEKKKIKEENKEKEEKEKKVESTKHEPNKKINLSKTTMFYDKHNNLTIVYHKVLPGQTLYGIATNYGVPIEALRLWNKIKDNKIYVGQVLIVKLEGRWEKVGVVHKGDTLFTIKVKYGPKSKASVLGGSSTVVPFQPIISQVRHFKSIPRVNKNDEDVGKPLTSSYNADIVFYKTGYTYIKHVVRRGQTLYSIGKNYGISPQDIMRWNNVTPMTLKENQILLIRLKGRYVQIGRVNRGDTLKSIKKKYGKHAFILGYGWPFGQNLREGMLIYKKE